MKRRLIRHAPIALVCGLTVFAILNVVAWYNLRGVRNVCRRQDYTRDSLRILSQQIEAYREEHSTFPESLVVIPKVHQSWRLPDGPPTDDWGTPFVYNTSNTEFTLRSLGRDRKPGGVGLDADIDAREPKTGITLATFSQFFTETDSSEVDRGGFTTAGLIAAIVVFLTAFNALGDADVDKQALRPMSFIGYSLLVVVLASIVGAVLMPLHIPSGH
ncbi:MAG TPA: hypothetical protein DDW52_24280 [Planctomycetaceae bacterium]|nr:hypothetical protein [Planctomycetaceae bacterium]